MAIFVSEVSGLGGGGGGGGGGGAGKSKFIEMMHGGTLRLIQFQPSSI